VTKDLKVLDLQDFKILRFAQDGGVKDGGGKLQKNIRVVTMHHPDVEI